MGKWFTSDEYLLLNNPKSGLIGTPTNIVEVYIDNYRILAWVRHIQGAYWWSSFDDHPPRGPFETIEAAELACQIVANLTPAGERYNILNK